MHNRNVGGGKKPWRTYYSTLPDRLEEKIGWISALPEDQRTTILGQMEKYATDEIEYFSKRKTDRQWGRMLEKLQKHLNGRREGIMSDFTVDNTADIIQWFGHAAKKNIAFKNTPRTQKKNTAVQSSSKESSSMASSSEESSASSKEKEEEEDGGGDGGDGGDGDDGGMPHMPQMGDMNGKLSLPRLHGAITCCC